MSKLNHAQFGEVEANTEEMSIYFRGSEVLNIMVMGNVTHADSWIKSYVDKENRKELLWSDGKVDCGINLEGINQLADKQFMVKGEEVKEWLSNETCRLEAERQEDKFIHITNYVNSINDPKFGTLEFSNEDGVIYFKARTIFNLIGLRVTPNITCLIGRYKLTDNCKRCNWTDGRAVWGITLAGINNLVYQLTDDKHHAGKLVSEWLTKVLNEQFNNREVDVEMKVITKTETCAKLEDRVQELNSKDEQIVNLKRTVKELTVSGVHDKLSNVLLQIDNYKLQHRLGDLTEAELDKSLVTLNSMAVELIRKDLEMRK